MWHRTWLAPVAMLPALAAAALAAPPQDPSESDSLAAQLREAEANVFSSGVRPIVVPKKVSKMSDMLFNQLRAWLDAANRRDAQAWAEVDSKEEWEAFAGRRIAALRRSLGTFSEPPEDLNVQVTRTIRRDGFRIENLTFQSRPGLIVTASLYVPDPPRTRMPGIVICHSSHGPKSQVELQDMGTMWARQGAMALVLDQLGY